MCIQVESKVRNEARKNVPSVNCKKTLKKYLSRMTLSNLAASYFIAGSFRVYPVIDSWDLWYLGICFGNLTISRPTLSCCHWLKFIYTKCCHMFQYLKCSITQRHILTCWDSLWNELNNIETTILLASCKSKTVRLYYCKNDILTRWESCFGNGIGIRLSCIVVMSWRFCSQSWEKYINFT